MVNSRQKGALGELKVKEFLDSNTPHIFERTPGSGSGKIKGDLHIPNELNRFCIEVKNYAESPLSDKILTNKTNDLVNWWDKLHSDCIHWNQEPLLFFKYNRSKLFVCTAQKPEHIIKRVDIPFINCYIMLASEWIEREEIKWVHT